MKQAGRNLLLALLFASIASADAGAQQKVTVLESQVPARPQSVNQIVGNQEQKPSGDASNSTKQIESVPAQVVTIPQATVIPPPPNVVRLSAQSISIPADKVSTDSKYEQRPALVSRATVGSAFGVRRDPFTRRAKFHSGVDIKARHGRTDRFRHPCDGARISIEQHRII